LQESTIYRRREKLNKMTDGLGLGDAYAATIERIKAQDGDKPRLGMEALMWISHAERPLRADELCHALAIELGSRDFNSGNLPSISTLVGCCQGLITVDKEESTVRLIHFTLQEYLSAHPDIFSQPHSAMAETCLTYLNSQQIKALPADLSPATLNMPFLEYCSFHWGAHAKRELSDSTKSLSLELLQEYDGHISAGFFPEQVESLRFREFDINSRYNGLHCASFFGIVEVAAALIEIGSYDINGGDPWGHTPLSWAARNGHEGVVITLLRTQEVNPDKPDNSAQTPLSFAAWGGHEGVVKILLGYEEVNPENPTDYGRTPLLHAAWGGHEGVVRILLGREEVDPDKRDDGGQTPLSFAAEWGHEGVVKILLGRKEVNPDKSSVYGQTPLWHAAQNGHEGVVNILLGQERVDPDRADTYGQTPLLCAAWGGYEGVVNVLLARKEVNPDKPDSGGQTPLFYAARYGREEVVKILLRREEVNPGRTSVCGETPLSYAARSGREGVVKILLEREEVNPDLPDDDGRTALAHAAQNGHAGVVKILREREQVNLANADNDGLIPLLSALWMAIRGR